MPKKKTIEDKEFLEEGTIMRKLKLINGNLIEIERGNAMFDDNFGLVRGTKTGELYKKYELQE